MAPTKETGKKSPSAGTVTMNRGVALTKEECVGLGGKTTDTTPSLNCASGQECIRADQDGVLHHACLSVTSATAR
jgi:hypothetical protein